MLLSAGSRVASTGMQWDESRTRLRNQGGPPTLIEPVSGTITLRNLENASAVAAVALDGSGSPFVAPAPARKTSDGWAIAVGQPATTWYTLTVKR